MSCWQLAACNNGVIPVTKSQFGNRCYIEGMRRLHRIDKSIIGSIGILLVLGTASAWMIHDERLTFNWTPCVPVGVYQDITLSKPLHDGEWVSLCPPISASVKQEIRHDWLMRSASSACADHLVPFIKHVVAVPGQIVTLSAQGMAVDGHLIPRTTVQPIAPVPNQNVHLIHYPFGTYTVKKGTFWEFANDNKWAFDSRYYGPIPDNNILSGARPIWTWKEGRAAS